MAHGAANHPAYAAYYAMQAALQAQDPRAYLACNLGRPSLNDVLPGLTTSGPRQVFLKPFMAVPGEATLKLLASDEPNSWKSLLWQQGCQTRLLPDGLLADPKIVALWLEHLEAAYSHFR
jgi:sirohydrochlorin cobaltochelatase